MFTDFVISEKRTDVAEDEAVTRLLNDAKRYSTLNAEEVLHTLRQYRLTGDISLRDHIVMANLKMVVSAARNYMPREAGKSAVSFQLCDLVQEGTAGFMAGLDKYDEVKSNGAKVTTYCHDWINKHILLYLDTNHKTVTNVGARPQRLVNQYNKAASRLIQLHETENIPIDLALPSMEGPKKRGTREGMRQLMVAGNPRTDSFKLSDFLPDGAEHIEDPMAVVRRAIETLPAIDKQLITAQLEGKEELKEVCAKQKISPNSLPHRLRNIVNALRLALITPIKPKCTRVLETLGGIEDRECPGLFSHPLLPFALYDDGDTLLIQARDMETRQAWERKIPATLQQARSLIQAFNPGWQLRCVQATLMELLPPKIQALPQARAVRRKPVRRQNAEGATISLAFFG